MDRIWRKKIEKEIDKLGDKEWLKKGSKRTWDIWKNLSPEEKLTKSVTIRVTADELKLLEEIRNKLGVKNREILLSGIEEMKKLL